jgi:hypothetical protein
MSTPVYPILTSDDPDIASWKEGISEDPTLRSQKSAGLMTTRLQFTRVPKKWEFSYAMLADVDKQLLERFEKEEAHFGVTSFHWINFQEAYGCPPRLPNMTVEVGQIIQPLSPNGRSYKCTTGGVTDENSIPTWPTTVNATVQDNEVFWTENTYRVRFAVPLQFAIAARIDFWQVLVSLVEV